MQKKLTDRFHQDVFDLCKKHFGWMLQDGLPLPVLQQAANNVQPIAAVALQRAGIEAMVELGMMGGAPVVMQPQPQQPPQEHQGSEQSDQGPEDDHGMPQGNPFDQ